MNAQPDLNDFKENVLYYADINHYLLKKCETINPDNRFKMSANDTTLHDFYTISRYIYDDIPSESFIKNVLAPYCIIRDELEQFLHDIYHDTTTRKHITGLVRHMRRQGYTNFKINDKVYK